MRVLKNKLKIIIQLLANLIPYGQDFYLKYLGTSGEIKYRGVFSSYKEALSEIKQKTVKEKYNEYDVLNKKKESKIELGEENLDAWFNADDYPFLYWVSNSVSYSDSLLELGGSLGHFYYSSQKYTRYPGDFRWIIAELEAAVVLGKKVAKMRDDKRLRFVLSSDLSLAEETDLFISAGTIQYIEKDLDQILLSLKKRPKRVIINRLPVINEGESYWTLQNLGVCEVPYRVYSSVSLMESLKVLGYSVCAEWSHPRKVSIPFHLEREVTDYIGFYLELDASAKQ